MPQNAHKNQLHATIRRPTGQHEKIDEDVFVQEHDRGENPILAVLYVKDKQAASQFLRDRLKFNRLAVEDSLSPDERPSMHEYKKHLFLVAPMVTSSNGDETYTEAAIFVGVNFMLVVCDTHSPIIDDWLNRWEERESQDDGNMAFQLHALLDGIVDAYFPPCDDIEEAVDCLEDTVFENREGIIAEALRLKRRILQLRRRIAPLRDVVNGLLRRDVEYIPRELQPFLQDVYDHTLRVAEMVDINRDILSGVLDAHLAMVSNNLNVAMRILTAGAMFLMTASLIAGIYGMNFEFMPELHQVWGYPYAFLLMIGLMAIEWVYFKKKGWF
jgi:magnesium transporter